jgi:hypothetical protein
MECRARWGLTAFARELPAWMGSMKEVGHAAYRRAGRRKRLAILDVVVGRGKTWEAALEASRGKVARGKVEDEGGTGG